MKVLNQSKSDNWIFYNGDCVEATKGLKENSIDYSIFSPPFASLYTYSDSERDMGNCKSDKEFFEHFTFLTDQLFRIIKPGRLCSIHCMDIPALKFKDGYIGYKDFSGKIIETMENSGFYMHGPRITIWKDPLIQAVRTKAIQLAHKQIIKDSAMCATGSPDYIVTFRKPGENQEPINHKDGFTYYIGTKKEPKDRKNLEDQRSNKYSHKIWQRYASPVWFDINQTNTLNIKMAREKEDERHICPLQLDVIARCLELWTNKKDVVLSPFAGIGSEGYQAILMKRKFIGIELKKSYYRCGVRNLKSAEKTTNANKLG